MMNMRKHFLAVAALALGLAASHAHAIAVSGEILRDDNDLYSFALDPLDSIGPLFFEEGEGLEFDYDFNTGIASVTETQLFILESAAGDTALFILFDLQIDTNDTDGFLSATADVQFDGEERQLLFFNDNLPGTPFNTTSLNNGVFEAFISGGSDLRLNFAFRGLVGPPGQVAEPAALALFAFGALALGFSRRRR